MQFKKKGFVIDFILNDQGLGEITKIHTNQKIYYSST